MFYTRCNGGSAAAGARSNERDVPCSSIKQNRTFGNVPEQLFNSTDFSAFDSRNGEPPCPFMVVLQTAQVMRSVPKSFGKKLFG